MNNKSITLNPSLVYDLYSDGWKPQIARIALLLDVFTPLAEGPKDARTMAVRCGCDKTGIGFLLDYLSSIEVLGKEENEYSLTETAAAFLVPASPSYAGDWLLLQTGEAMWGGILKTVRGAPRDFPLTPWAQDAWLESYKQSRVSESLEMWAAAGFEPGKCGNLHILDLACGCAIKSFTLAEADEAIRVTCVDSSDVLEVARDLAGRKGLLQRVAFQPGDIHTIDLEPGSYSAVLLGQYSYFLTLEQNQDLFRRIYKALKPDGVLVIDALMTPETPSDLASMMSLVLWGYYGGSTHSFEEYKNILKKTGFRSVEQHSDWWLTAVK